MKKSILISIAVVLMAALLVVPVAAKTSVVKGEVTAIGTGDNTITVITQRDQTVVVNLPVGFDLTTIALGDEIIVKGRFQNDGSLTADWVRKVDAAEAEDEAAPEGSKATDSTYCNGDKQTPHPMAAALAEQYGVSTEWVMGYFCDGYGMGAIMLALKTQEINGADANTLLAQRAGGQGWGAIWQELKMIGSERQVQPPPGLLKKQGHSHN